MTTTILRNRLLHRWRQLRPAPLVWESQEHDDEPRDQQTDLPGGYWANIGPDGRRKPDGWSWTVLDFDDDNTTVASGFADTEAEAKAAVTAWAKAHKREGRA